MKITRSIKLTRSPEASNSSETSDTPQPLCAESSVQIFTGSAFYFLGWVIFPGYSRLGTNHDESGKIKKIVISPFLMLNRLNRLSNLFTHWNGLSNPFSQSTTPCIFFKHLYTASWDLHENDRFPRSSQHKLNTLPWSTQHISNINKQHNHKHKWS